MVIIMARNKGFVRGFGVNDSGYVVHSADGELQIFCPFYVKWSKMLERCYCEKYKIKHKTYTECIVCDEWLVFSNFKRWIDSQDWEGNQLDKDLIFIGNKIYSPETCVFVTPLVNTFVTDCGSARGEMPIGVNRCNKTSKFEARCRNPFTGKKEYLGRFSDIDSAHLVWKNRKHELACQLADMQTDERVAAALRIRYL